MADLILEIVDVSTDSVVQDIRLTEAEASAACRLLEIEETSFPRGAVFDLSREETAEIMSSNKRSGYTDSRFRIRARDRLDDLPYRIHTNRELHLMLLGVKPLAVFSIRWNEDPSTLTPEQFFAPHVEARRIVRRDYVALDKDGSGAASHIRRILYALPHEAWRIDAYIMLCATACKTGWNATLERMEGSLLGYEEWQTECYMNEIFNHEGR